MQSSKITSKNQTTVPKKIREELGVGPNDVLHWELLDGAVRVTPSTRSFLRRRGQIRLGQGSVAADIRKARRKRGTDLA